MVPLVGLAGTFHWWGAVPDVSTVLLDVYELVRGQGTGQWTVGVQR